MKLKIALMAAAVALSSSAFAADKKTSISVFGNVSGQSSGIGQLLARQLCIDPLEFTAAGPRARGPSRAPRPAPAVAA